MARLVPAAAIGVGRAALNDDENTRKRRLLNEFSIKIKPVHVLYTYTNIYKYTAGRNTCPFGRFSRITNEGAGGAL